MHNPINYWREQNSVRQLTLAEFRTFVTSRPVAVIHVDAAWNAYRERVRVAMLEAEAAWGEFAAFAEVDCDVEAELSGALRVANVPCVAYFHEGNMVASLVGVQDVRERTERVLNGAPIRSF